MAMKINAPFAVLPHDYYADDAVWNVWERRGRDWNLAYSLARKVGSKLYERFRVPFYLTEKRPKPGPRLVPRGR